MFNPRPKQQEVLKYCGGLMGVSAVPGSGKTQILSYLAAKIIADGSINDNQEILIVTLVNSAVNNFSSRISTIMQGFGLLPNLGYRVLTLHSLANQIVHERPDLVGLDNQFQIIDERETNNILSSAVESWIHRNRAYIQSWTKEDNSFNDHKLNQAWETALTSIAKNFIRKAKDLQATPTQISKKIKSANLNDPLLQFGIDIYQDYQRALHFRSAVDFDDLIRYALLSLKMDSEFLSRLRNRWPYILEDEAQDSSLLQEQILQLLSGDNGNWVRVGDPNQAIYETFTTASPEHLKNFLMRSDVVAKDLPNSGRSAIPIINLANELIRWTNEDHINVSLREALIKPYILPTPIGDPQPNPEARPNAIIIHNEAISADKELGLVASSVKRFLQENPNQTVAILVPRNDRGAKLVDVLQREKIPYLEILQTSQSTRESAKKLNEILQFIEDPTRKANIVSLYESFDKIFFHSTRKLKDEILSLLKSCTCLEEYLYPQPGKGWLSKIEFEPSSPELDIIRNLEIFREYLVRWQAASELPIHQLIITLGQDLFTEPTDLALSYKLALLLEHGSRNHPDWQLPEFANELKLIAENRRKMYGFGDEDTGFDPELHKGKVIVTTYHKAKGLEWDRVYLLSVNTYDFPSAQVSDASISEKYFYRDQINLEAEIIAKLVALLSDNIEAIFIEDGEATKQARLDYAAERLRLLFVGITRAKRELIITWNKGDSTRNQGNPPSAAIPLIALKTYLEVQNDG